jgi:hypothetical protein
VIKRASSLGPITRLGLRRWALLQWWPLAAATNFRHACCWQPMMQPQTAS